jgi:molybdenum cofactor cytidylyltransferase
MEFREVEPRAAVGAIAAHSVRQGDLVVKKGDRISAEQADAFASAGVARVAVALLGPDDRHEDEVAAELARRAAGAHVRVAAPFTGRANLFAEAAGVLRIDAAGVDRFNAIDERVTIATLANHRVVQPGEMVGTVKIIPFAVDVGTVARVAALSRGLLAVAPFAGKRVGVVSTLAPGLKPKTIAKTIQALAARLAAGGATLVADRRTPHETQALAGAIREGAADSDLTVVFGASAVTDRRDVLPAAIEAAGGRLIHVGMPVDPGNLLVLGELQGKPVIGAPGCARSPRENGFDWVLQRLLADIPVTPRDIMGMGVGGLLMEIVTRPQPRDPAADG